MCAYVSTYTHIVHLIMNGFLKFLLIYLIAIMDGGMKENFSPAPFLLFKACEFFMSFLCFVVRMNVMWQHFRIWYKGFEESQDERLMERMAVIHYNSANARQFLTIWRKKTELKLEDMWHLVRQYSLTIFTNFSKAVAKWSLLAILKIVLEF